MRTKAVSLALMSAALIGLAMMTSSARPALSRTAACPVSSTDQAVDAEEQGSSPSSTTTPDDHQGGWFSRDIATLNYFPGDHVDPNGRDPGARLTWCGVTYSNYAENIYAGTPDAQSVFDAWRNSPIHNANMLRDGVTSAGIARTYDAASTYGWYWALDVTNSAPLATTSTTAVPTTTTTTTAPTTAPAAGTPEWWAWCSAQRQAAGG